MKRCIVSAVLSKRGLMLVSLDHIPSCSIFLRLLIPCAIFHDIPKVKSLDRCCTSYKYVITLAYRCRERVWVSLFWKVPNALYGIQPGDDDGEIFSTPLIIAHTLGRIRTGPPINDSSKTCPSARLPSQATQNCNPSAIDTHCHAQEGREKPCIKRRRTASDYSINSGTGLCYSLA